MVSLSSMGAYLQKPIFFDLLASEQTLNCGIHPCPSKCHQLVDHSKLKCKVGVVTKCVNNHTVYKECHDKYAVVNCPTCMRQKRQAEDAVRRAAEQAAHEGKMAELEVRLAAERLTAVKREGLPELTENHPSFLFGATPWRLRAAAGNTTPPTTTTLLASSGAYRPPVLRGASSPTIRTPSGSKVTVKSSPFGNAKPREEPVRSASPQKYEDGFQPVTQKWRPKFRGLGEAPPR